ncbi:hypothetical protein NQ318_013458 [Aromia moschata]|uniref:Cytochrome P450 n=1 Tax=Aromia moschata TaxID=1265417 RepID=A0AAV8YR45_9CUCU|nr:hypothetical protein NQ318_013458 [Aromia moschata]
MYIFADPKKVPSTSTIIQSIQVYTKDCRIPGSDLTIENGTSIMIPLLGIQYDPKYFTDPEEFDPERFNEENKAQRHNFRD